MTSRAMPKRAPNIILKALRQSRRSPSRPSEALGRSELADMVNRELMELGAENQSIDGNYVGKLEQGKIGSPREEIRRTAFRRALQVASDGELGFFPYRRDPLHAGSLDLGSQTLGSFGYDDNRPSEAGFFGDVDVTIVTPLKKESIQGRPVVAMEDFTGAQQLGDLVRSLGLTPSFESVSADGVIDLNRKGLVVICGPRISEQVAKVLAQDKRFHFAKAEDGPWTLVDRSSGEVFRSGQDAVPSDTFDFAYLGRLPRPDKRGSILIFTGIHPQGSLGVVRHLSSNLPEIYAQTGDRNFSVLLRIDYDAGSSEPANVELLMPFHYPGEM